MHNDFLYLRQTQQDSKSNSKLNFMRILEAFEGSQCS